MARTCERPTCAQPADVSYGIDPYELVVTIEAYDDERSYLEFETRMHASYGVLPHMYNNLLLGVRDAVRGALADDWNAAHEAAWTSRLALLTAEIHAAPSRTDC